MTCYTHIPLYYTVTIIARTGATEFTLTPELAHSIAILYIRFSTPARAAPVCLKQTIMNALKVLTLTNCLHGHYPDNCSRMYEPQQLCFWLYYIYDNTQFLLLYIFLPLLLSVCSNTADSFQQRSVQCNKATSISNDRLEQHAVSKEPKTKF